MMKAGLSVSMDGWMDGWVGGRADGWTDRQTDTICQGTQACRDLCRLHMLERAIFYSAMHF